MGKLIVFLSMVFFITMSFGQEQYDTYETSYFTDDYTTHDVLLSYKSETKYTLYVSMVSMDGFHPTGGILLNRYDNGDFKEVLNKAKCKYIEWLKAPDVKDVGKLYESTSYKTKTGGFFKCSDGWYVQPTVYVSFNFGIIGDEKRLLVKSSEMKSSGDECNIYEGFVFVFSNVDEINYFLDMLSEDRISDHINDSQQKIH